MPGINETMQTKLNNNINTLLLNLPTYPGHLLYSI